MLSAPLAIAQQLHCATLGTIDLAQVSQRHFCFFLQNKTIIDISKISTEYPPVKPSFTFSTTRYISNEYPMREEQMMRIYRKPFPKKNLSI